MKNNSLKSENGLESTTISQEEVNNSNLYLDEKDSKGVPLLRRIEKYPDLPEDEFIPIECTLSSGKTIPLNYLVNKLGEIKNKNTENILKPIPNTKGYMNVNILGISPFIHRLVASTFLINPNDKVYSVVNHIDHNKSNNRLDNLEFTTFADNANKDSGKSLKVSNNKLVKYIAIEPNTGEEVFTITKYNNPDNYNLIAIRTTIRKGENHTYKGYIWKSTESTRSSNRKKLEKLIGFSGNFNDYEWHEHWKYPGVYVCKEGFILKNNKLLGGLDKGNYIVLSLCSNDNKRINTRAHRVIMEYILGRDLKNDEIVDHINTIPYDNSFDNLRITDLKGNMNNPNTIDNMSKKLVLADKFGDFIAYGTSKELSKIVYKDSKFSQMSYLEFIKTHFSGDEYLCTEPENSDMLLKKMCRVIYVFNSTKTSVLGAFRSIEHLNRSNEFPFGTKAIRKSLEKGKIIVRPTGKYIVMKGSKAVELVLKLGHGTALKFKTNSKEVKVLKKETTTNKQPTIKLKLFSSLQKPVKEFDLFGNLIKEYNSIDEANWNYNKSYIGLERVISDNPTSFLCRNHLWCRLGNESKIDNDLKFIFYKFNDNKDLLEASSTINKFAENKSSKHNMIKKYINTGMPAPDGYYYQQGDPKNMIYDPENKNLIRKRKIIKWKPNYKK